MKLGNVANWSGDAVYGDSERGGSKMHCGWSSKVLCSAILVQFLGNEMKLPGMSWEGRICSDSTLGAYQKINV